MSKRSPVVVALGRNVRKSREALNYSQEILAEKADHYDFGIAEKLTAFSWQVSRNEPARTKNFGCLSKLNKR